MATKSENIVEHAGSGLKMPEPIAARIDELAKELPADFKYTRMAKAVAAPELGMHDGSRTDVSMITTDDPDREGDVVLPIGLNLSDFLKSPDVFFAHDYSQIPVGRALWVKPKDNGIAAKTQYAQRPAGWSAEWLPDALFSLMQEGMCRGKSVGFIPQSKRVPTADELQRRPDWKGRTIIDKAMMLEYSVAPIPMNPKAMAIAVSKCVKDETQQKVFIAAAKLFGTDITEKDMSDAMTNEAVMPPCPKCLTLKNVTRKNDASGMHACSMCGTEFQYKDADGDNDGDKPKPVKAMTPEEVAIKAKADKLAKALDIVVPILQPESLRAFRENHIERMVNEKVGHAINEAFARRKGRA